jgi:alpha-mannosidase
MKQSEEGKELVVRLVEIEGKETTVNLTVPVNVSAVRRLNLIELPLANANKPIVKGKTIQVKVKPNEIVTLGMTVAK